jgi:hypothetical protein
MSDFGGVFEVLASDDSQARLASRRALVLSETRINERLGSFLASSKTAEEFDARLSYVDDDFKGIIAVACEEVGHGKPEAIYASLTAHYRPAVQTRTASLVHESRKPKMCPYHSEVVDISLGAGDPKAGYDVMQGHAWGGNHCQGDWEGKCNFKREMVTQSYWDDRQKALDEQKAERQQLQPDNPVPEGVDTPTEDVTPSESTEPIGEAGEGSDSNVVEFPSPVDGAADIEVPISVAASAEDWQRHAGLIKMALTRKDYNLLAGAIKSAPIDNHAEVAGHFADHLSDTNERFDRDRFVNAATPESSGESGVESKVADAAPSQESFPCQQCGTTVRGFHGQGNGECPNCGTAHLTNGQRASKDYNPSDQADESSKTVPCPECGGDGKTNGGKECHRCKGQGHVNDWGPSTLDAVGSSHTAVIAGDKKWIQKAVKKPGELHKDLGVPEGEKIPEEKLEEAENSDDPKVRERAQFAENVKGLGKGKKSADQQYSVPAPSDDPRRLLWQSAEGACQHCNGLGKEPSDPRIPCQHCGGTGRTAGVRTADSEGNAGLGGPSPKMDKALWTPKNVKKIEVPSDEHPTKEKDPIQPIKAVNDDPLEEIGEKTTERVDLPEAGINLDDSGFAGNNQEQAPGTKTWTGTDGLADPVTTQAFAKADDVEINPLRPLLNDGFAGFVPASVVDRVTVS